MQGPFINRQTFWQRVKQLLAPVVVVLKVGWPFFKMSGFMLISLFFYAKAFGLPFAAGFILLLFVHETGHLLAARMVGLKVGLPVFIPFMGALIALKEAPRNAWIEAIVGIGGPLLGSLGALAVASCYAFTENPLFLVLGYTGFFLNLFNLIPIVPLDGGRIVSAISPWLWVVGLAILVPYVVFFIHGPFMFILLLIVITSLPRVLALFRGRTPEQMRYFECTLGQRVAMAVLYFGLIISLYLGMGYLRSLMRPGAF